MSGIKSSSAGVLEVKISPISGRGVFTKIQFRAGEVVLAWNPVRYLTVSDVARSDSADHHYLFPLPDGRWILMGEPERYVNHSCEPNTMVSGMTDVAIRDIAVGEEITSSYAVESSLVKFDCSCPRCVALRRSQV